MGNVTSRDVERATPRVPWTREQVLAHCRQRTLTNVENLSAITGIGQNAIYDDIARGTWTATRVLRVGRLIKIPTADILETLGLEATANQVHPDGHPDTRPPCNP